MDFLGCGPGEQFFPQRLIAEHLCKLRQDLQVQVSRFFGDQQHENQINRLTIRSIESDRLAQRTNAPIASLKSFDPAMRNGNALS
jgi:hypothetical protein